ncbi:putative sucrose:sucrose fructosyltransferase [Helianthus annuus]|nr:putative sucrose:sucrose fructosyltransferase [Helianthus annuus]
MMASSTTTTPLILHDDPENLSKLTATRRLSIAKVLSGILVSVLVICAFVALINNQTYEPPAATTFATQLPNIDLKRVPGKLDSSAEVEWQRSAYHFQPDKNFISGTKLNFIRTTDSYTL